ncbi:rho guanine nucleotide exchange factor 3 [Harpegnathos saltator]|uniref:Rho guanine nucleotide exchange factor 3 n=1 Tax=Harpegnathos saltator TaxID=610380 RepID=E2C5I9_HARSA|nr:rho guanine nucleotide exchange factor 3 [Harpegnathos saltator]XP_011151069.1 rho guanine nucleotide exchange factor 3 [Harpegnathos saltator]EFN76802.1 Rho guanine nucleotide exchange factor 3 [Harpegnathos saltator]
MNDDCSTTTKETFQEPRKKFWLRSRKRPKSDAMSISSMDISIDSDIGNKKKRPRITEVASSIFPSLVAMNKQRNIMQRSFTIVPDSDLSIIEDDADIGVSRKKLKKSTGSCNNLTIRSWLSDVAHTQDKECLNTVLTRSEVKRQEAIYELYCGENVLLNDLFILRDFYYEPILPTGICTSEELTILFGDITNLIQIHSNLRDELLQLRDRSGFTKVVGPTILKWLSTIKKPYLERCRTLIWARHLLDEKRIGNKRFQSFLKKRLESPRSVDLWTYLDVPRSRIVKYPLLVKEILKHTPVSDADHSLLKEAGDVLSDLLQDIDRTMGDAECKLAQSKINVKVEHDPDKYIANATELITKGLLKDTRGLKYYCFLFDTCFAITRPIRRFSKKYNLFLPVVPKDQICVQVEDKNIAEIGFKIGEQFFITEDEHKKRHWVDSFDKLRLRKISDKVLNAHDKENLPSAELSKSNYITRESMSSTRTSTSSINDNYLSFFIKKNLLKQKRNSIGYIY